VNNNKSVLRDFLKTENVAYLLFIVCGILLKTPNESCAEDSMHNIKIKTERLLLRPLTVADANEVFEWVSDERVSRYMVYTTYTNIEQVSEWLAFVEKDTSTYNFGFERFSDGKLIGSGDIGPARKNGYWVFGYNLRYDCWGNGYATEAAKAMIEYARNNFGATHFASSHAEPNLASGHVMQKCGLRFVGCGEFKKLDGSCKMKSMDYEGEIDMAGQDIDHEQGEVVIYQTDDGNTKIDVRFVDETVWLTQQQMAELFQSSRTNIVEHIQHIYEERELDEESTCRKFRQIRMEGNRQVSREMPHYNLDMIISLGYRVKSKIATNFRRWATERLKEYMIKGFAMDDERLKNLGGGNYWKELLDRIRDIRSSEKVMYRQVLDLYATSVDYDPKSSESIAFFKMVQNKLHYAAHGHTASEVIYERADAKKPFMGLTSFSGDFPTEKDIGIAKNYLSEDELKILNGIVSGYFDFAEVQAMRHNPMYMSDYVEHLDNVLKTTGEKLLTDAGKISHTQAIDKAKREYRKYTVQNLSPVEEAYLQTIKNISKKAEEV